VSYCERHKTTLSWREKGMTSSTVVELDISSHKTKSGYPLVVSGRTLSLVATINGKRSVLPLDKPMEFYEKQSNQ
jgi:hypothetical protein